MNADMDVLAEIPCFKCLFWEWKKESHLYCNPKECRELTEWLLKQAENYEQKEADLTITIRQHVKLGRKLS